jgi:hypothetical protein
MLMKLRQFHKIITNIVIGLIMLVFGVSCSTGIPSPTVVEKQTQTVTQLINTATPASTPTITPTPAPLAARVNNEGILLEDYNAELKRLQSADTAAGLKTTLDASV